MLKKTIVYKDYNDKERTEDHYFNLDEGEIMEMEMSVSGGYATMIEKVIDAKSEPELFKLFKDFVLKTYGEKSSDGKYFLKENENGEPLVNKFLRSRAYSALMMEFMTKKGSFTDFVNGVIPAAMAEKYRASLPNSVASDNSNPAT